MSSTTTPTTPQTLLDAVNALLGAIRVSGVMSLLAADLNGDAAAAKEALDAASLEVQRKSWEFNRIREYTIDPETNGHIVLPSNTLKVSSARSWSGNRLVQRGGKLYDPKLRTYAIGKAVTVDITLALPFEELTDAARSYVTAIAARRFCLPRLPTGATFQYTEEFLRDARLTVEGEDADVLDAPLTYTNPHIGAFRRT